jgi:predicted phage tail protein
MLRPIKVYGSLAKFLGARSFMADVKSPAEAVRFLIANFPGIEAHMSERHYKVSVGRFELEAGAEPEQLTYPVNGGEPIRIVPVLTGAGATGRIIAGVALVALSWLLRGDQLGLLVGQGYLTAALNAANYRGAWRIPCPRRRRSTADTNTNAASCRT